MFYWQMKQPCCFVVLLQSRVLGVVLNLTIVWSTVFAKIANKFKECKI